ncbi:cytochrome P450 [Tanacetum coccineum]
MRSELGIFEAEPGGNEPEDEIHGDNSGNDSNSEKESNSDEDSDTGNEISLSDDFSKNCHIVVNDRKVCPSNANVKSLSGDVSTSHARFRVNDKTPLSYRPLKPKLNRASSVPPPSLHGNNTTYRRKRFASFRHFKFPKIPWLEGDGFLAIKGTWLPVDTACLFIVVYTPQCIHKKKALWDALNLIISSHDCLTIILGDYNEVRNESERAGSIFCPRGANLFNDFISSTGLHEIPIGGQRFTRMNRIGSKLSKLDRFLVSSQFIDRWPTAYVTALTKEYFDNSPLLLNLSSGDFSPVPFRFFNSWLHFDDFKPMLLKCWAEYHSRETLYKIDLKAEVAPLSANDIELRSLTVKELTIIDHLRLKDLRQRAKSRWALEGDENSRPSYTSNLFKRLNVDDSSMLDLHFSIQEIKDAVWSCGGEKAPEPDGFTFKLLKKNWDVFGSDIISYVKEFKATFSMPKGCNSSFIALVPKIDDPLSLNDF